MKTKLNFIEQFKIVLLNRSNHVIGCVNISTGNATSTIAAIKANAYGFIISHNHPFGSLKLSRADEALTQKIKMTDQHYGMRVLNQVIVSNEGHYSLPTKGCWNPSFINANTTVQGYINSILLIVLQKLSEKEYYLA